MSNLCSNRKDSSCTNSLQETKLKQANNDEKNSFQQQKLHPLSVENLTGTNNDNNNRMKSTDEEHGYDYTIESNCNIEENLSVIDPEFQENTYSGKKDFMQSNSLMNICSLVETVKHSICRLEQDLKSDIGK